MTPENIVNGHRTFGEGITDAERYAQGMATRRAVLGDAYVDRTVAQTNGFSEDLQDYITRNAWGDIWARPGLDRRARAIAALTAMIALNYQDELAMAVATARRSGLTVDEIKEIILQASLYCGVPAANTATKVAVEVLQGLGDL